MCVLRASVLACVLWCALRVVSMLLAAQPCDHHSATQPQVKLLFEACEERQSSQVCVQVYSLQDGSREMASVCRRFLLWGIVVCFGELAMVWSNHVDGRLLAAVGGVLCALLAFFVDGCWRAANCWTGASLRFAVRNTWHSEQDRDWGEGREGEAGGGGRDAAAGAVKPLARFFFLRNFLEGFKSAGLWCWFAECANGTLVGY